MQTGKKYSSQRSKTSKSSSSKRWLMHYHKDPYVKAAKDQGYRSRSAFKLLEIQKKTQFLLPGKTIIDLGAAPGGWSQALIRLLGKPKDKNSQIVSLDLLPIKPIKGVVCLQGDFQDKITLAALQAAIENKPVDYILSDMAPNTTGIKQVDQLQSMQLAFYTLDFIKNWLAPQGDSLIKVFQGSEFDHYLKAMREVFKTVSIIKPQASKPTSRESYLLGCNRR